MILAIRDAFYGVAVLAGLASVYTTLGTLNGRLAGGFSLHNLPWAISVATFAAATIGGVIVKIILLRRRRRQAPLRGWPGID